MVLTNRVSLEFYLKSVMRKIKGIFVLFSLVLLSSGCKKERINEYKYHIPEASGDGWEVSSSDEVGISSGLSLTPKRLLPL